MTISGISSSSNGINFYQTEAEQKTQQEGIAGSKEQYVSPGKALLNTSSRALNIINLMKANGIAINSDSIIKKLDELEQEFAEQVKRELKARGVADNIDFRVSLDENGNVKVYSSHKDAKAVQRYFDDNPQLAEKVADIEALSSLKSALNKNKEAAANMSPVALKKNLQMESLNLFFAGLGEEDGEDLNSLFTPQILSYANNKISTFSGIRTTA
jgi:flagellar hook-length control protein FliK